MACEGLNMTKAWYEESDDSAWWQATKKNTHKVCPSWFQSTIEYNENPVKEAILIFGAKEVASRLFGINTSLSAIAGAGSLTEIGIASGLASHAYCFGAMGASMLDAWYQVNHEGRHALSDKWDFDTQAVQNLMIGIDRKWKKDLYSVELFLNSAGEWWKS
jgi:hypothetical protein